MFEKLCLTFFSPFLRHSFSLTWGLLIRLDWLAMKPQGSSFFSLPSTGITLIFTLKTKPETHFGDRIQVFMLAGHALWTHWIFSQALFWSLASRLYCLAAWLTGQKAPGIFLSLSPQSWRKGNLPSYRCYLFYFKNLWVWETKFRSSTEPPPQILEAVFSMGR